MYPIKFESLYYDKVCRGCELESFRNNLPDGDRRRELGYFI